MFDIPKTLQISNPYLNLIIIASSGLLFISKTDPSAVEVKILRDYKFRVFQTKGPFDHLKLDNLENRLETRFSTLILT